MDIISPSFNGGWVDQEVLREQAQVRVPAAAVEQPRDEQGRFRSYQEVPTNQTDERL